MRNEETTKSCVSSVEETDVVDLLMKQYQMLKQDLLMQASSVKNHVRNSQIVGASLIAIVSVLIGNKDFSISASNQYLWMVAMFGITTLSYYLIYDVLESAFVVKSLETYLSYLEEKINDISRSKILIWQSSIANNLWPLSGSIKMIPPIRCLVFYELILIFTTTVVLPLFVYYQIWIISADNTAVLSALYLLGAYSAASICVAVWVWVGVDRHLQYSVQQLIRRVEDQSKLRI